MWVLCPFHSCTLRKMTSTSNGMQNFLKPRSKDVKLIADRKLHVLWMRIL